LSKTAFRQPNLHMKTPKAKPQVGEIERLKGTAKAGRRGARWHKVTFTLVWFSRHLKG